MAIAAEPFVAPERPALAPFLAGLAGLFATLLAAAALYEMSAVRDVSFARTIGAALLFLIATGAAPPTARATAIGRAGLRLALTALVAFGTVEEPAWVSIETFGIGVLGPWLALAALGAFFVLERGRDAATAGLLALVIGSAFGGPFFVRNGDDFHALHTLLTIAAVGAAAPPRGMPRGSFGWIGLLLVVATASPIFTAGDRDRHLEGFLRILATFAPLLLVASVPPTDERPIRPLMAGFLVTAILGAAAAIAVVVEGALHLDLARSLAVRLPLFGEHPNIIAPYFAALLPLLAAMVSTSARLRRIGLVVLFVATLACLALTRSRAAIGGAAVAIALFVLLVALPACERRFGARLARLALLLAFVVVGSVGYAARDRIVAKLRDPSMTFRVYMWETAVDAIRDRPLVGYGLLAAEPLMNHATESELDSRSKDTHPHMQPLALAMGAGIPAALLYLALVGCLVVGCARTALRDADHARRALAAGIAASAIAVLASNLLDQGLALATAIPLHVGHLVGLTLLLRRDPRSAHPPTSESRLPANLARGGLGLAFLLVGSDALAARLVGLARLESRERDHETALRLTTLATYCDPLDRDVRFAHVDAIDRTGDRARAAEELARLTESLPDSPYPWERLGNLEFDRRNFSAAIAALTRALERDPTGPSAAQWSLRIGTMCAELGMRDDAMDRFAAAFRYDYIAAKRANWRQDDQKEYFIPCGSTELPIYLSGINKRNRELLPDLVATDPVKARRLATTLVRIEMSFRRYKAARDTIAFYRSLTTVPWLPLDHLENEIAHIESTDAQPDATPPAAIDPAAQTPDAPVATPSPEAAAPADSNADELSRYQDVAGQSILYVDLARAELAKHEIARAITLLDEGLARTYDMVAERESIAALLALRFEAEIARGEPAAVRLAAERSLYFHGRPGDRLAIQLRLGTFLNAAHDAAGSVAALASALDYLGLIGPERGAKDVESTARLAAELLKSEPTRTLAAELLDRSLARGEVLAVACVARFKIGDGPAATDLLRRLRRDRPEWLPAVRLGK